MKEELSEHLKKMEAMGLDRCHDFLIVAIQDENEYITYSNTSYALGAAMKAQAHCESIIGEDNYEEIEEDEDDEESI